MPTPMAFAGTADAALSRSRIRRLVCAAFIAVFVVHALNYAYFFVDDEAIPFIYAQNVLDGHGLVYNPDDGPVEGYSDFLSVWLDVALLWTVATLGGSKLTALAAGHLVAFTCSFLLLVVTFHLLTRQFRNALPIIAGMAFMVLSGPLAVWSWSALETSMFALICALLLALLFGIERPHAGSDRWLLVTVVAALLCRIDGFVWVGALLLPALIWSPPERRTDLVWRVVAPALLVFAMYHAWRLWYFGELLPMPVYAKVLYKLRHSGMLVANTPREPYVLAFLRSYYWIPIAILMAGFAGSYYRSCAMRSLGATIVLVVGYLWIVGDWMFGFRFFVPLIVPLAILGGSAFQDLQRRTRRWAPIALVVWMAVLGLTARDFWNAYQSREARASWLRMPSLDPARFFAPYYEIYLSARPHVHPGETTVYSQAGFVPFMLGVRNIDDLGICSKLYAKLPTTDVIFTEVGRYSPLTGHSQIDASQAYTVARAPRLVMAPGGNIRAANGGRVPPTVLGGAYRLLFSSLVVAGYERVTDRPLQAPEYLENVAHISHLKRASVCGRLLDQDGYRGSLPFLYGQRGELMFEGSCRADFTFDDPDTLIHTLHIEWIRSAAPASVEVRVLDKAQGLLRRDAFELEPQQWHTFHASLERPTPAAGLSIVITPHTLGAQTIDIEDVRVQGQTQALRHFIATYDHLD